MGSYSVIEDCAELEKMAAALGRECGKCSLCCKLMGVPELEKPAGPWCAHCDPGNKRCMIYDSRPTTCREFYCQWMIDRSFGDEWRPSRCKMVLKMLPNDGCGPSMRLDVNVDPSFPDAWLRAPYQARLKALSAAAAVYVHVGDRHLLLSS